MVSIQLSWIKNVEFAGAYIADTKGYYKAAGFEKVNLIAGGPTAPAGRRVVVGQGARRHLRPGITAPAINKGADAQDHRRAVPEEPVLRDVPGASPIKTPEDMIGKKIGVQATNEAVWTAFLKANNIDASKITKVPVQFDPTPLATGRGRRLVLVRHQRAEPAEVKGVETVTLPAQRLRLPAGRPRCTW